MTMIIDIKPYLDEDTEAFVSNMIENARDDQERAFWREIQLSILFDKYHTLTGSYHPKDPAALDTENILIKE